MKKTTLLIAVVLLLMLCACGGGAESTEFEPDELTDSLLDGKCFTDLLSEMDESTALELYGIDADMVDSSCVYLGTGATAEEIAVFKAKDADSADDIADLLKTRVSSQIKAYENYVPAEVPKLKKAIVKTAGCYAVYVTADNADEAEEIIDTYMN